MNSWSSWSRVKKITVIGTIVTATILAAPLLWLSISIADRISLSQRLTSTIREHTIHKDIFIESKVIEKYEKGPFNLNGDGEMGGIFQLTEAEALVLLQSNELLKCSVSENCRTEEILSGSRCARADSDDEIIYTLCVDQLTSRVEWSVFRY